MRAKGIAYDTGFVVDGRNSIEHLDMDRVRRELRIIRDDLHCTAVHLVGADPSRLARAGRYAAELGLEVWFSPYPIGHTPDEIRDLLAACADEAERLRVAGRKAAAEVAGEVAAAEVVRVAAAEVAGEVAAADVGAEVVGAAAVEVVGAEVVGAAEAAEADVAGAEAGTEVGADVGTEVRTEVAGAEVVFVAGVELSLMARGFIPGDTLPERLAYLLGDPATRADRIAQVRTRLNDFFREALPDIRARFHGRVTYAAIQYEGVDWTPFDIVTYELIRSAAVADRFREGVRLLAAGPKPLAITGFGAATWRGAGDVAQHSMDIVEHDPATGLPLRLTGDYERDEQEQAAYIGELLTIFDEEGVDSAFVHLFALDNYPHRPDGDPRYDLDIASPGVVKVYENRTGDTYPGLPWEPKAAFRAIATRYGRS
jgi:hypothetical protein